MYEVCSRPAGKKVFERIGVSEDGLGVFKTVQVGTVILLSSGTCWQEEEGCMRGRAEGVGSV